MTSVLGTSKTALSRMHKKLPSFSFSSEPDSNGEPRRSRSIFSKLSGGSSSRSSHNRSPSPYAGRSASKSKGSNSRSSSIERESALSDADSDSDGGALSSSERFGGSSSGRRYSGTAYESETSASEMEYSEGDLTDEEEDLSPDEMDELVNANTEANAGTKTAQDILLAQPTPSENLEDGPNLVKSPASPFAMSSSSNANRPGQPRRRKSTLKQEFAVNASRPVYERNRCSITLTHGDPEKYMEELNMSGKNRRRPKSYVVASDLSEESYYAIEWAIGSFNNHAVKVPRLNSAINRNGLATW